MDFSWTGDDIAFRQEVQEFIKKHLPEGWEDRTLNEEEMYAASGGYKQLLAENRWRVMSWPVEYGGLGYGLWRQIIYQEEMAYHNFPGSNDPGVGVIAPLLMHAGSDELRRYFLPRIANAELEWCQLFTEPESGSDLASLKTRAVADGDDYVVNGQKVFNTGAHLADWGLLACRTDFEVPKHRGISFLLVDMKSPGLTVRPLINMTGAHSQNEVFLEDVRVPRMNLIGEENRGWYLLAAALSNERSGGAARPARYRRHLEALTKFAAETPFDGATLAKRPDVRGKLAELAIEIEVNRWVAYRGVWMQTQGLDPRRENSTAKAFGGELSQRIANAGITMLGLYGGLRRDSKYTPMDGRFENLYKETVFHTIGLGTSEINRNVIAERALGLPRVS